MATANITKSPQTTIWAGMTPYVISAQDSFLTSPGDHAKTMVSAVWVWSDGTFDLGPCIQKTFLIAGTISGTLTVKFANGKKATASTTVVVTAAPTFSGFDKYVDYSAGNDANPGTIADPYKTYERACSAWRSYRGDHISGTTKTPGRISLKSGTSVTFTGLNDGTHNTDPGFGPLLVTVYGGTARATLSCTTSGADAFYISSSGSDNAKVGSGGYNVNAFDNHVVFAGVDLTFASAGSMADPTTVNLDHVGVALQNSKVTNAGLKISDNGNGTPDCATTFNVEVLGSARNGVFWSCAYSHMNYLNAHDNGTKVGFDGQLYCSAGIARCGLQNFTLSRGAVVGDFDALHLSDVSKLYVADGMIDNASWGFGLGSNIDGSVPSTEVLGDRIVIKNIDHSSVSLSWCSSCSVRNVVAINIAGSAIFLNSYDASHYVNDCEVILSSFSNVTAGVQVGAGGVGFMRNVVVEDSVFRQKAAGTGVEDAVMMQMSSSDIPNFTSNNNCFYRVGDTHSSVTFGFIGGLISFDTWKSTYGEDRQSQYGDPLFTNPDSDLSLMAGSPCIDAGLSLTQCATDYLLHNRPQGPAYDIGAYEYVTPVGVTINGGNLDCGAAMSPVIVLTYGSGSNVISPFFPTLTYGHSTHDSRQAFERWADTANNFACWGNGEPVDYVDEEGVTCQKHTGRVSSTKTGRTAPVFNNFLFTDFFSKFIPKTIAFDPLWDEDYHERKPLTTGTGESRRYYQSTPMRHAVYGPDQATRDDGWNAIQTFNHETMLKRPMFHNGLNALQAGGPVPFLYPSGGPPEEVNHNKLDDLGNARSWNAVSNTISYNDGSGQGTNWNAWDKQHNAGPPMHSAALVGNHAAIVNLWNNYRWFFTSFFPGANGNPQVGSSGRGTAFDVPRSVGFQALLAVYAYCAGFEWADPQMIKYHVGGNANGDGTGQNSNKGWKPSEVMDWIVQSALGTAVASNGLAQQPPKGFIYWNFGCDNLGGPACICCGASHAPGPGTSGCLSTGAWVGQDGVNYGSQVVHVDLWHAGICFAGLILIEELNKYLIKTWGPGAAVLQTSTAANLKATREAYAQEAVYRAVNSDYSAAHYYGVTGHLWTDPQGSPRGYDFDIATQMLTDMFLCDSAHASGCEVRQINDGSGQWIVAEIARRSQDLFYGLSAFWLAYTFGTTNPLVQAWMQNRAYMPYPGDESSTASHSYAHYATFTDTAWALLEAGGPVVILNATMSCGAKLDGQASVGSTLQGGVMACGAAIDGNAATAVTIKNAVMKAGAEIVGIPGRGVSITSTVMKAGAAIDGLVGNPVYIDGGVLAAGAKLVTTPSGSGPIIITGGRLRAGAGISFTGVQVGGVVIIATTMACGAAIDAGTSVNWTESVMAAGAAIDGDWEFSNFVLISGAVLSCGATIKRARAVIQYHNSRAASGNAIVLEG